MKPNKIENALIASQINLEGIETARSNKILKRLIKANDEISAFLRKKGKIDTKAKYNEVRQFIKKTAKDLQEQVFYTLDIDNFLADELELQSVIYGKIGKLENLMLPTVEQIKTSVLFIPYADSRTFDSFRKNVGEQFFNAWDSAVRTGYMTGLTTPEVIKMVKGTKAMNAMPATYGTMNAFANSLEANTRTLLQSFANETRKIVLNKNKSLFKGYKWLATLDRRTCLVCGNYDGKIEADINDFEQPPIHPNCRCIIVGLLKDVDDFEDTRESEDGQVDSKISYEEWLEGRTKSEQMEILGKSRFEMFSKGVRLDGFVNDGRIIKLNILKEGES